MDISLKWILPIPLLLVIAKIVTPRVPAYTNYCGSLQLNGDGQNEGDTAGLLKYEYLASPSLNCQPKIIIADEYSFIFRTVGLTPYPYYCTSNNTVTIKSRYNELKYCANELDDTTTQGWNWHEYKYSETVDIELSHTSREAFIFDIDFYIAHYGHCMGNEVDCGGRCIHTSLACNYDNKYCDTDRYQLCSDITTEKSSSNLIAGVISAAVFMFLLLIICCVCVKRDRFPCFGNYFHRQNNSESVASRARTIFTVQLATRGVNSGDEGNDNQAYTADGEPIDPSLFHPPPEYSSLENIDQQGKYETDGGDLPPTYDDAIENQKKYKVVIDMQENK